jgi:hypothetical protein
MLCGPSSDAKFVAAEDCIAHLSSKFFWWHLPLSPPLQGGEETSKSPGSERMIGICDLPFGLAEMKPTDQNLIQGRVFGGDW